MFTLWGDIKGDRNFTLHTLAPNFVKIRCGVTRQSLTLEMSDYRRMFPTMLLQGVEALVREVVAARYQSEPMDPIQGGARGCKSAP